MLKTQNKNKDQYKVLVFIWFSVKCWGNPVQVNLTGGLIMTIGIFMPWKIELCFVIS